MTVKELVEMCCDNHKTQYQLWKWHNKKCEMIKVYEGFDDCMPAELREQEVDTLNAPPKENIISANLFDFIEEE